MRKDLTMNNKISKSQETNLDLIPDGEITDTDCGRITKFFRKIKRFLLKNKINWYIMELIKSHTLEGDKNNECCLVEILH